MITRHRNQAFLGLAVWIGVLVGLVSLGMFAPHKEGEAAQFNSRLLTAVLVVGFVMAMLSFLWGGYHLAKGKGYSSALAAFGLFPCVQPVVLTVLFVLPDKNAASSNRMKSRQTSHSSESPISRVVRYRRNALVGNILGLFVVLVGISIIYFPVGLFEDFEDEALCGFFVFVCGYVSLIVGCRWWLVAKGWPDAVIFIGLVPLAACMVPYVWEVFIIVPDLLPLSMFLMALILLVVVFTLPDKSGLSNLRRRDRR